MYKQLSAVTLRVPVATYIQNFGRKIMRYENPVIQSDYSDPDVIRVGSDYFMVASSFNYVPGVPVLHSKNLVEWRGQDFRRRI